MKAGTGPWPNARRLDGCFRYRRGADNDSKDRTGGYCAFAMTDHAGEVWAEIGKLDPAVMSANATEHKSRHVLDDAREAPWLPAWSHGALSFGQIVEDAYESDETAASVKGAADREIGPELGPVLAIVQDLPPDSAASCERFPELGNHPLIAGVTLQKPAISAKRFRRRISRQVRERLVHEDDGITCSARIGDDDAGGQDKRCRSVVDGAAGDRLAGRDRRRGFEAPITRRRDVIWLFRHGGMHRSSGIARSDGGEGGDDALDVKTMMCGPFRPASACSIVRYVLTIRTGARRQSG